MEGGILAPGAVTYLLRPQATATAFEESKAAAVPRRYLRSRELHAGHGGRECPAVPRTDVERRAVARAPLPASSVSGPSLPCPGAQAGDRSRGWPRGGHSRAGKREAEEGRDPRCFSGPAPYFPLAEGPLTAHVLLPRNSPRQMGRGAKTVIAVPIGLLQPPAFYLVERRIVDWRGDAGGPPPRAVRGSCLGLSPSPHCRRLSLVLCVHQRRFSSFRAIYI